MNTLRVAVSTLTCVAVIGGMATVQAASVPPEIKASRNCRKAIASALSKVTTTGLGVIGGCHKSRDKGKFSGDCNQLGQSDVKAKFAASETKATTAIAKKCVAG